MHRVLWVAFPRGNRREVAYGVSHGAELLGEDHRQRQREVLLSHGNDEGAKPFLGYSVVRCVVYRLLDDIPLGLESITESLEALPVAHRQQFRDVLHDHTGRRQLCNDVGENSDEVVSFVVVPPVLLAVSTETLGDYIGE